MAKKTSKKSTKKPAAKPSGTTLSLDGASVAQLERALAARKRGAASLLKKRERLANQLRDVDTELAGLGIRPDGSAVSAASGGTGSRPRNDKTLPEAMVGVMKGKELRVRDIADAVLASGYQSSSANFTTIVSQALGREDKRFKKVSRGVYTAK